MVRLDRRLTPSGFHAYRLLLELAGEPERVLDVVSEPEVSGRASVRNLLLPIKGFGAVPQTNGRLLAVGTRTARWVDERRCGLASTSHPDEGSSVHEGAENGVVVDGYSERGAALLRRGARLVMLEPEGGESDFGFLPEGDGDPGEPIAAGVTSSVDGEGFPALRVLFCRTIQHHGSPWPSYRLSLRDVSPNGSSLPQALLQLEGKAPPLGAMVHGDRCLLVANGAFQENVVSTGAEPIVGFPSGGGDEEMDDELLALWVERGFVGPQTITARPSAVLTELSVSADALTGVKARVTSSQQGMPAIAVCAASGPACELALTVVLRTREGHGAIVRCSAADHDNAALAVHVDTFPGLGLLCDTPGFAYLVLSPDGGLVAIGRWRGATSVELFAHPHGAASAPTRSLPLPNGAQLQGIHLKDDVVYVWHNQGLDRFAVMRSGSTAVDEVQNTEPQAAGHAAEDGWNTAPVAADVSGDWHDGF